MIDLKGKKILLIGIGFYDYEDEIKRKLISYGAVVSYFSSSYNSIFKRLLDRLHLFFGEQYLSRHYLLKLISNLDGGADFVIIIKAENFMQVHIDELKKKNPNAKFLLYLWDSLERLYNKKLLLNNFKNIVTFDRLDSIKYGLAFRPLFYREKNEIKLNDIEYDVSFVGFDHSNRYPIISKIKRQLENAGKKYKIVLVNGKFSIFIGRYITHRIKKEDIAIFKNENISYLQYMKIMGKSQAIIDISHPKQSGLTMRTIEVICNGKKLITTNKDIENYGLPKDSYYIIDSANPVLGVDFFSQPKTNPIDTTKYSLDFFINELFEVLAR